MIRPFVIGFATTLKHLFKKPITVNYPEQKFPMFPKYRGKQVLMRDENGLEKCVACGLCSVACPADAIYLEAAENDGTVQAGPRYASVYQIHKTRCIFCGYCEEACPVGAIFMGKDYELAVYSKDDFVWDKTDLLVPATTRRRRAPDRAWAGRDQRLAFRPIRLPALSLPPMQIGALGDIHGAFDDGSGHHDAAPGRAAVGAGRRRRQQRRRVFRAGRAALLDQGQQRGLRRHRGGGRRPAAGADAALSAATAGRTSSARGASPRSAARSRRAGTTRRPPRCRRRKGRRRRRHVGEARQEPRRQAPALRARRGARVQGADEHRSVPDARSAAPVLSGRPPHRRRQDGDQRSARRDAAAAAPVRPPSRVHRFGPPGRPLDRPRRRHQVLPARSTPRRSRCERLDT